MTYARYLLDEIDTWPVDDPRRLLIPRKPTSGMGVVALNLAMNGTGITFTWAMTAQWYLLANGFKGQPCCGAYSLEDLEGIGELDRRRRDLRRFGWETDSATVSSSEHRLGKIGQYVWHPGWSENKGVASKIRDSLFRRDKYRCQDCLLKEGMMRDDGSVVRLEVGRILPGSRGGSYKLGNCRAECNMCNGPRKGSDKYFPKMQDFFPHA
jgi:hypothetical protein